MEGGRTAGAALGPCHECGLALPAGTQRYCIHCGAEVVASGEPSWFDNSVTRPAPFSPAPPRPSAGAAPSAPAVPPIPPAPQVPLSPAPPQFTDTGSLRRPTTWSSGDYRAPAPTDAAGVPQPAPPPPPPGVEWNGPGDVTVTLPPEPQTGSVPPPGEGWFEGDPQAPEVPGELGTDGSADPGPATVHAPAGPDAPPQQPGWPAGPDDVEQMLPFAPSRPVGAGPIRLEIAYPPDPVPDDTDARGHRLFPPAGLAGAAAGPAGGARVRQPSGVPPAPGMAPLGSHRPPLGGGPPPPGPGAGGGFPAPHQAHQPAFPQEAGTGWNDPWAGGVVGPVPSEPAMASRRSPVPMLLAAGLVLVTVTVSVLWWLHGQGPADGTATQPGVPVTVASAAPTVAGAEITPGATGSAAADATPSDSATESPSPSADPAVFTAAMDGLLDESASARTSVSSTVAALQVCRTSATKAAAALREAGQTRTGLAQRGGSLDGSVVPGGADAVAAFVALEEASAAADDAYAAWADDVAASGCRSSAPRTMNWALGNQHSAEATNAKSRFVGIWNPIAAENGLASRSTAAI